MAGVPVSAVLAFGASWIESRGGSSRLAQSAMFVLLLVAAGALVPTLTASMELVAGAPVSRIASSWDSLRGWQRGILGSLVAFAAVLAFGAVGGGVVVLLGGN